ncbi:hypothetical protein EH31_09820 [Erythrobacter longus]|uniref:Uncharacterized protein n=2 Tax=Erythrobacter longus TaxID=1044 RepID=A0A074MXM8_ERYLO|nr:hypothetical protein EH31_09820 [Erythrobacter longus]
MMTEMKENPKGGTLRKLALPLTLGGITGFALAIGVGQFADGLGETGLSTSAEIATLIGAFYVLLSVFVGGGTMMPSAGAKLLNVEDADELREQRTMLLQSSYAMGLWGIALLFLALSGSFEVLTPAISLAAAGVFYALGVYFVVRSYGASDELMMAVNREAGNWSYGLVFVFLGGWSALAHAGYIAAPAPLDVLSAFYAMVLIATFIAAGRRGMLKVR